MVSESIRSRACRLEICTGLIERLMRGMEDWVSMGVCVL